MHQDSPEAYDTVTIPLTKRDRKALRHRWHHALFMLSSATTVGILILIGVLATVVAGSGTVRSSLNAEDLNIVIFSVVLVPLAPVAVIVLRTFRLSKFYSTGAMASSQQFEHVHLMVAHYAKLAGLDHTPSISIVTGTDFKAKTASNFGRTMILIHSDLLDAPRPFGTDWGALRFAIAREIGHIAAGHRSIIYEFCTALTQSAPFISHPLARAEEYTADRYAAAIATDAAADYFAVMAVSKDCWQDMSIHAAVARAGQVPFGQTIAAWTTQTPPTVWRVQALAWLGVFLCEPIGNHTESPQDYRHYLTRLPTRPIQRADLRLRQAAFLLPPKPMPQEALERLSPKGTNLELLERHTKD